MCVYKAEPDVLFRPENVIFISGYFQATSIEPDPTLYPCTMGQVENILKNPIYRLDIVGRIDLT